MSARSALFPLFVLPALTWLLPSCSSGGGGSGQSSLDPPGGHGSVLPDAPVGAGAAGLLDGLYDVVAVQIVPDASNTTVDPTDVNVAAGTQLRFEAGVLVAIDDDDPRDQDPTHGAAPVEPEVLYFTNAPSGALSAFCIGLRFSAPAQQFGGEFHTGILAGTTSSTGGVAAVAEIEDFTSPLLPGGRLLTRVRYEVTLLRAAPEANGAPSLEQVAGSTGPTHPSGR